MGDDLDDLSAFLESKYQARIDGILDRLGEIVLPETYSGLIGMAREAFSLYNDLLEAIAESEGFEIGPSD
jgi:hypothetical protein